MSKKHMKGEYESPTVSTVLLETDACLCQASGSQIEIAAMTSDIGVEDFTIDGAFSW